MANYAFWNHQRHQLWTGGGVKLPTGKFQPEAGHELVPAANMEPGSGNPPTWFYLLPMWSQPASGASIPMPTIR